MVRNEKTKFLSHHNFFIKTLTKTEDVYIEDVIKQSNGSIFWTYTVMLKLIAQINYKSKFGIHFFSQIGISCLKCYFVTEPLGCDRN